ncbi:MAG: hypothetical protein JJU29_09205 [Verrucomicrobia bacterium]|nr:hypothetical protein [Verrucomicrobiota bacterium]MCH8513152.1 hypothetical protein [Kiritimatiellia bacterium]
MPPVPSAPNAGEGLKRLDIVGVNLVQGSGWDQRTPFRQQLGYTLSVLATFHGPLHRTKETTITRAVTLEGVSLLPHARDIDATARKVSDSGRYLVEFTLNPPPEDSRGLRLIEGEFLYYNASKTQTMDLGWIEVKEGARIEEFDTTMENVQVRNQDGNAPKYFFSLKLPLDSMRIRKLTFENEDGTPLVVERENKRRGFQATTITFQSVLPLPERIRVGMEGYTDLKLNRKPFVIENRDFMGRPLL